MTVKELYEYAVEHGVENLDLVIDDATYSEPILMDVMVDEIIDNCVVLRRE